jgi:hypothetical protein
MHGKKTSNSYKLMAGKPNWKTTLERYKKKTIQNRLRTGSNAALVCYTA